MATSVRLEDAFVEDVKIRAEAMHRSVPKQIEYMAKIGQIAMDNPDLSYAFIEEALLAKAEMDSGALIPYERKTRK
ncbi:TA system antitoxin ParD family protein [Zhongshania sp.]|jgi:hypothetical protein|uniref:TA system antitoxin ParD family protein n=1 Tax=Zhongshania sp. TaxID=1971902 RepID=UPI002A839270|nr:hypothetical protein [Zhongshania sp.]